MLRTSLISRLFVAALVTAGLAVSDGIASSAPPIKTVTITPVGNQMKFEKTTFTVEPGQKVRITFKNTATSAAMQHNVVVLTTSDSDVISRIGQAAASASNYVPDDPAILAATDMAKPGDTVEVTFTAPETSGEYKYICTFPGHYMSMQGTMIVE